MTAQRGMLEGCKKMILTTKINKAVVTLIKVVSPKNALA